jgi:hypothetical protein
LLADGSSIPKPAHADGPECWPALPLDAWRDTCATLHMWTQIVGKVRMRLTPLVNHWWNVPLYVTARGLTTSRIPYRGRAFELWFDFVAHRLVLETSEGTVSTLKLEPRTVADFYKECMAMLHAADIDVRVWRMPVEIPEPIPFDEDTVHASYDAARVETFWRILLSVDAVFHQFRSGYVGKVSPVHFFWGSFDLAASRFSGRRAPERPTANIIEQEAYSHEVSSVGWWPGNGGFDAPMFYAYAAPEPPGFRDSKVGPVQAFYDAKIGEFLLPYDAVRNSADPAAAVMEFFQSTYEASANLGAWDRAALERQR